MDGYEQEIARQPSGPFSIQERKRVRRCAEHWVEGRRYSEERNRRLATYAKWIGIAVPAAIAILKFGEAFFSKGSP